MSAVVLRCISFWRCFYNTLFACFPLLVFQPKASCRPFPRSAAASVVILRSRLPRQFPAFLAVRVSRKRVTHSHKSPAPAMHTAEAAHIAAVRLSGQRPGFPGRLRTVRSNRWFAFAPLRFQLPRAPFSPSDTMFAHPARQRQRLAHYPHGCAFSWFPLGLPRPAANGRPDFAPLFPSYVRLVLPRENLPKDSLPPVITTDMNLPHAA
jgi:hypothetical protein